MKRMLTMFSFMLTIAMTLGVIKFIRYCLEPDVKITMGKVDR